MDWENERYVRFYTRRTAEDLALCWQALALWPHLLAVADLSGYIRIKQGERRLKLLAGLLRFPVDLVQAGMPDLLEDGRIREINAGYFIPNFMDAQEARTSDKERQRKRRQRLREDAMAELNGGVTKRDDLSRNVTVSVTASRNVTSGHKTDENVTPSLAEPSLAFKTSSLPSSPNLRVVPPPDPVPGEEEEEELRFQAVKAKLAAARQALAEYAAPPPVDTAPARAELQREDDLEPEEPPATDAQVRELYATMLVATHPQLRPKLPARPVPRDVLKEHTLSQWEGHFAACFAVPPKRATFAQDGYPLAALISPGVIANKMPLRPARRRLCSRCQTPRAELFTGLDGRRLCYPCLGASYPQEILVGGGGT
jgi:hypothetical protein